MQTYEWSLEQICEFVDHNLLQIPAFQRKFVWKNDDIENLLDSILRGMPIGALTLGRATFDVGVIPWKYEENEVEGEWKTMKEFSEIRENAKKTIRSGKKEVDTYLVLDGQQRLTSIWLGLNKGDFYACFTDKAQGFKRIEDVSQHLGAVVHKSKDSSTAMHIPLDLMTRELIGEDSYLKDRFRKTLAGQAAGTGKKGKAKEKRFILLAHHLKKVLMSDYPVPCIIAESDQEDLIEYFERSNMGGKKLTFFDLLNAKTFDKFGSGQGFKNYNSFREAMEGEMAGVYNVQTGHPELEFKKSQEHFMRARCFHDIVKLRGTEDEISGSPLGKPAILRVATGNLLYNRFGEWINEFHQGKQLLLDWGLTTKHDAMPFPLMAVPAFFFIKALQFTWQDATEDQANFFKWWYWMSVFSERYSYKTNESCEKDILMLEKVAKAKEGAIPDDYIDEQRAVFGLEPDGEMKVKALNGTQGHTQKAILQLGIFALRSTDFRNGMELEKMPTLKSDAEKGVERHHILPRAWLNSAAYRGTKSEVNSICNIMFASRKAHENIEEAPSVYLGTEYKKKLKSEEMLTHFISEDMLEKLKDGKYDHDLREFTIDRAKEILEVVGKAAGRRTGKKVIAALG